MLKKRKYCFFGHYVHHHIIHIIIHIPVRIDNNVHMRETWEEKQHKLLIPLFFKVTPTRHLMRGHYYSWIFTLLQELPMRCQRFIPRIPFHSANEKKRQRKSIQHLGASREKRNERDVCVVFVCQATRTRRWPLAFGVTCDGEDLTVAPIPLDPLRYADGRHIQRVQTFCKLHWQHEQFYFGR